MASSAERRSGSSGTEKEQKPNEESKNICFEAFKFSHSFFSNHVQKLINIDKFNEDNYQEQLNKDRKIINERLQTMINNFFPSGSANNIVNSIVERWKNQKQYLCVIEGPVGSYKNRLVQYLYLSLRTNEQLKEIPIFYISFSKYEKSNNDREFDATNNIENIEKTIKELNESSCVPILVLDNVRMFDCGTGTIYNQFENALRDCKVMIIVSKDVKFNQLSEREQQHFQVNAEGEQPLSYMICSERLSEKQNCIQSIQSWVKFFTDIDREQLNSGALQEYWENDKFNAEAFYKKLKELKLFTIDAYQLKLILKAMTRLRQLTLATIYGQICIDEGINVAGIEERMYTYEYSDNHISFDEDWFKAIQHKSILEYSIAQYYIDKINKANNITDIPDVILTDGIDRFIELNDRLKTKIVNIVKKEYETCSNYYALAQLIFLVGGDSVPLPEIKKALLSKLKCETDKTTQYRIALALRTVYVRLIYLGDIEATKEYFHNLIRDENMIHANINIGFTLDYYGDTKNIFNGDIRKAYDCVKNDSCNAWNKIELDIKDRIEQSSSPIPILILQLFTCCQILRREQKKIDHLSAVKDWLGKILSRIDIDNTSDIIEYFKQKESDICEQLNNNHIESVKKRCKQDIEKLKKERIQLSYMRDEYIVNGLSEEDINSVKSQIDDKDKQIKNYPIIKKIKEGICLSDSDKIKIDRYNKVSIMSSVIRSGLSCKKEYKDSYSSQKVITMYQEQKRKQEANKLPMKKKDIPESEAEHAFNCWLLGYIFLPEFIPNHKEYDKQRLLNLLLVYNIKNLTPIRFRRMNQYSKADKDFKQARSVMEHILGKSQCLDDWENMLCPEKNDSNNGVNQGKGGCKQDDPWLIIAADIDTIQKVYQYFRYYCDGHENDSNDIKSKMLKDLKDLRTKIGKSIAKKVILLNEKSLKNNDKLRAEFYDTYFALNSTIHIRKLRKMSNLLKRMRKVKKCKNYKFHFNLHGKL